MKKILSLAAIAIGLTACSGDSDSEQDSAINPINNVDTSVFLKKSITTHSDGTIITANYSYDNNKLTLIEYSDGDKDIYHYEDKKINKIEEFRQDELYKTSLFTYNGGENSDLAILDETFANGQLQRTTFQFYTDVNDYSKKANVTKRGAKYESGIILFNGNNIQSYSILTEGTITNSFTYAFDSKNNPFRNVYHNDILSIAKQNGGVNNIYSYTKGGAGQSDGYTSTFEYNEKNFPLKETQTTKDGKATII